MKRNLSATGILLLLTGVVQAQISNVEYAYCYGSTRTHNDPSPSLRVQLWVTPVFAIDLPKGLYPSKFNGPQSLWNVAFLEHVKNNGLYQPSMGWCFESFNEELTHQERATTLLGSESIDEVLDLDWWPNIGRRISATAQASPIGWEISFAVGAVVSSAVDHQYGRVGEEGAYTVERFQDSESRFTQSPILMAHATFVDPFPFRDVDSINVDYGPSFGVSESPNGDESYYFGISVHFGHRMFITIGYNWSDVFRLPPGLAEESTTMLTSEELTAKRVSRTQRGGFLAFTIPLAGSEDGFIAIANRDSGSN